MFVATSTVPAEWNSNDDSAVLPATLHVPAGTQDGNYHLGVSLRGMDDGRTPRPLELTNRLLVKVDCVPPVPVTVPEPVLTPSQTDATPPVIGLTVTGPSSGGWFTGDVVLDWTVTDAESSVVTTGCDEVTVVEDTTVTTYTCVATSAGGTVVRSVTIQRDATAPSLDAAVQGTLGNGGWYRSDVTVAPTASDGGSGLADPAVCSPSPIVSDTTSAGVDVVCTATDVAGNTTTLSRNVKRDATGPTVTISVDDAYDIDQMIVPVWSWADPVPGSGLARSFCPPSASALAGPFNEALTVTATAADVAGNAASATDSYRIVPTVGGACRLISRYVTNAGVANSLCVKLRNSAAARTRGQITAANNLLAAYNQEVTAQAGKHIVVAGVPVLRLLTGLTYS